MFTTYQGSMLGASGSATLDFGSVPAENASVQITGQSGIIASSRAYAYFMSEVTTDNGTDEHEEAASLCPPGIWIAPMPR